MELLGLIVGVVGALVGGLGVWVAVLARRAADEAGRRAQISANMSARALDALLDYVNGRPVDDLNLRFDEHGNVVGVFANMSGRVTGFCNITATADLTLAKAADAE